MRTALAVLLFLASAAGALAQEDHSPLWYAEAQVACLGDATRLCASAMPNEERVRECMKTKRNLVSSACAAFYPGGSKYDSED